MRPFAILLLLSISVSTTRAQNYFQKTYGGSANETGATVGLTSDGGYIVGGSTNSFGSGSNDVYLVKLNSSCDTMWTMAVGTGGSELGSWLEQTNDDGYIITGTNGSLYLNKVDASGISVWAKSYGGGSGDEGKYVQQTPDNGYIVAGFTSSFGAGGTDVYLIKTNSSGDTLWTKTFGGSANDKAYSLDQTSDGGYIICGQTNSYGAGGSDVFVLKVNSAGILQWSKTYGGSSDEEASSIAQTTDNGYIITGTTSSFGSGLEEMYTIKTDSLGVVQWSKTYGEGDGNDRGNNIIQTSDGGYVITGSTTSFGSSTVVIYLVKIDGSGTLVWANPEFRIFGGNTGTDIANSVQQTLDGGYVFTGTTQSYGAGGSDIYLVRTNSFGDSSSVCGTGQVSPQVINAATVEASASAASGSGATVTSVAAISIGVSTAATKLPLGVLITTTSVSCFGNTDGQAVATVTAGTPPYSYGWSFGASTTETNTGFPPGTYFLTVIDTNGCSQVDTFIITEPAELLLSFTVDTIAGCGGGSNGVITGSLTGGTGPYNFNWSNGSSLSNTGNTSHTINGLAAGTYNLTVTDANGCTAIDTIKSGMTFTSGGTDANCTIANGSAWVSVTGGDAPYTYLWDDPGAQTNDTAAAIAPGIYTVMVTDANGCSDSSSVTVNSLFGGPDITIDSVVNVSCFGANDGGIYITITDGVFGLPPYTILWSNSATTDDITGLSGGTYTVEVTETATGCITSAIATVLGASAGLTVTITDSTDISCNGAGDGSATVSASGGTAPFTYSWTPSGGNGTVATSLPPNTYTATVLDANGCNSSASVTLSEPGAMTLTSDTLGESCTGGDGKAWVSVSGGLGPYTYLWSDAGMQSTDTAFNLTAGPYTVTVTDNNGCSNTALATIVQSGNPPSIVVDSTNDVTCNGGADGGVYISVSSGVMPYTYAWAPGLQITEDITNISAGTYTVVVVDNAGCATNNVVTITEPNALSIVVSGTDITCNGAGDGTSSVVASNGTGPYTYLWSSGGATSTKTGLLAGFSSVTVTDGCGATTSDSVNITDPSGITILPADTIDISCNGAADGEITINATGGTSPLSYSITGGPPFSNTTGVFLNLSAGTYNVVVQDASLCQMPGSSYTISEPPAISIDSAIAVDIIGCPGSLTGIITIVASGGTGSLTYSIDGGTNYQASGVFTGLGAGPYTVSVQDATPCTQAGAALTVNEPAAIVIGTDASTGITCNGYNDGTITMVASGGQGALTYSIDGGTTTFASGVFTGLPPGSYPVIVQDGVCSATGLTHILTDPAAITISGTKTDIDCFGNADGTITITASGGTVPLSYSINGIVGPFANTTGNFNNLASGTYDIAVQDSNGCVQAGSTLIITEPASVLSISDSVVGVTGCFGNSNGEIYLSGTGGAAPLVYSIDGGVSFDSGLGDFTNLAGGSYDPMVQDSNGCTASGPTLFISEPIALTVAEQSTGDPTKGNEDGFITVLANGGTIPYTYLWNDPNAQTTSTATGLRGGPYEISVTDGNGCVTTLQIEIFSPDNDLFIPTAFSPNGDFKNDKFIVRGTLKSLTMVIYNRWGEKIFETNNKNKGWDGTQNGVNATSGSYGYYIEIILIDGTEQGFKGDILLVR